MTVNKKKKKKKEITKKKQKESRNWFDNIDQAGQIVKYSDKQTFQQ